MGTVTGIGTCIWDPVLDSHPSKEAKRDPSEYGWKSNFSKNAYGISSMSRRSDCSEV